MKIAFIGHPGDSSTPATMTGSIAIFSWQVGRRLARDCDVSIYATAEGAGGGGPETYENVRFRRVSIAMDRRLWVPLARLRSLLPGAAPSFSSSLFFRQYARRVADDLAREGRDAVHVHTFPQFLPTLRSACPKARLVLHVQHEWLNQLDHHTTLARIRHADIIVGDSEYITNKVRGRFPELAGRCRTIFNGANFAGAGEFTAQAQSEDRQLLFVGRLSPEKGLHLLVEAMRIVVREHNHVRLTLIGGPDALPEEYVRSFDDPKTRDLLRFYPRGALARLKGHFRPGQTARAYQQHLESLVTPDIADRVVFTGPMPHDQVEQYYKRAHMLVFPSVWNEPNGMPTVEAAARGLPVITTRGGGLPEVVDDGRTGLLVERGDAGGLARAILRLVKDEELCRAMGRAGRERAIELFSWDRIAEQAREVYFGSAAAGRP